MNFYSFAAGLAAICTFMPAQAADDDLPPVFVITGADDAGMGQCQMDANSTTSAAEAAFRYNRVPLAGNEEYIKDKAIEFYIDINAF